MRACSDVRNHACLALVALLGLAAPGKAVGPAHAETVSLAAEGRRILAGQCERCHAIGHTGESALAAAPAFRLLHKKYPVDHLAEALAEGIATGHLAMPEFIFTPDEIAAILAYLASLEDEPKPKR
jgi:mono/diheme cytochrome c family protein